MNKIEKLLKTASIYFLGNIFTKLISFFLLPLYTSKISPTEFGEFGLIQSLINLVVPLVFFQIWDSVFRFAFDYNKESEKYNVISNGIIIMILGVILYTLGFGISNLFIKLDYKVLVYLYGMSIGIQYFYTVITRAFQKNSLFAISGCINAFAMILVNIVLIKFFNKGVESFYVSSIIGVLIQIIIIELKMKPLKNFKLKYINFKYMLNLVKFSAPISITTISQWLLAGLTQVIIGGYIGVYENGLFTVANKFSTILLLIVGVFQFAWNEMAYILSTDRKKNEYYEKSINEIFKITMLGCSIFLIVVKLIFPVLIDRQYNEAIVIIPIIMIGTAINSYTGFLGTIFLANKKSGNLFQSTIIAAIVNIVSSLILVPKYGLIGACISLSIAFLAGVISRIIMLKVQEDISIKGKNYFLLAIVFISIIIFYKIDNIIFLLIILIFLLIITCVVLKDLVLTILNIGKNKILNMYKN